MSLAVSRVICHCLVTEHRSHAVIIRPITRSLEGSKALLYPCGGEGLNVLFMCARSNISQRDTDETWCGPDLTCAPVWVVAWPVGMVVQIQRTWGQHLRQLVVVVEVEGEVCGDDGLSNDLQHLLVLAGSQVGENIVPFQLWETKRSIKKQKLHLWGIQLDYNILQVHHKATAQTSRSCMLQKTPCKTLIRTKSYDPLNAYVTDSSYKDSLPNIVKYFLFVLSWWHCCRTRWNIFYGYFLNCDPFSVLLIKLFSFLCPVKYTI